MAKKKRAKLEAAPPQASLSRAEIKRRAVQKIKEEFIGYNDFNDDEEEAMDYDDNEEDYEPDDGVDSDNDEDYEVDIKKKLSSDRKRRPSSRHRRRENTATFSPEAATLSYHQWYQENQCTENSVFENQIWMTESWQLLIDKGINIDRSPIHIEEGGITFSLEPCTTVCSSGNDKMFMNAGGQVTAMAWAHSSSVISVLAVAMLPDKEAHFVAQCKVAYIQFWQVPQTGLPFLSAILQMECGPVWDISWCPFKFQESQGITGLLAVSCFDSCVRIIKVPDLKPLEPDGEPVKSFTLSENVVTLEIEQDDPENHPLGPCLSVAWQCCKPYHKIAAGFASGKAGIWNLAFLTDRVLKAESAWTVDEVLVQRVCWSPDSTHLATISSFSLLRLWDVNDLRSPVVQDSSFGFCPAICWTPVRELMFASTSTGKGKCTRNVGIRQYNASTSKIRQLVLDLDHVWDLSYNNWMNVSAAGTDEGWLVLIHFPLNAWKDQENQRKYRFYKMQILQTDDVIQLEDSFRTFDKWSSHFQGGIPEPRKFPNSLMKVCFNPNFGSHTRLAYATRSGLVIIHDLAKLITK